MCEAGLRAERNSSAGPYNASERGAVRQPGRCAEPMSRRDMPRRQGQSAVIRWRAAPTAVGPSNPQVGPSSEEATGGADQSSDGAGVTAEPSAQEEAMSASELAAAFDKKAEEDLEEAVEIDEHFRERLAGVLPVQEAIVELFDTYFVQALSWPRKTPKALTDYCTNLGVAAVEAKRKAEDMVIHAASRSRDHERRNPWYFTIFVDTTDALIRVLREVEGFAEAGAGSERVKIGGGKKNRKQLTTEAPKGSSLDSKKFRDLRQNLQKVTHDFEKGVIYALEDTIAIAGGQVESLKSLQTKVPQVMDSGFEYDSKEQNEKLLNSERKKEILRVALETKADLKVNLLTKFNETVEGETKPTDGEDPQKPVMSADETDLAAYSLELEVEHLRGGLQDELNAEEAAAELKLKLIKEKQAAEKRRKDKMTARFDELSKGIEDGTKETAAQLIQDKMRAKLARLNAKKKEKEEKAKRRKEEFRAKMAGLKKQLDDEDQDQDEEIEEEEEAEEEEEEEEERGSLPDQETIDRIMEEGGKRRAAAEKEAKLKEAKLKEAKKEATSRGAGGPGPPERRSSEKKEVEAADHMKYLDFLRLLTKEVQTMDATRTVKANIASQFALNNHVQAYEESTKFEERVGFNVYQQNVSANAYSAAYRQGFTEFLKIQGTVAEDETGYCAKMDLNNHFRVARRIRDFPIFRTIFETHPSDGGEGEGEVLNVLTITCPVERGPGDVIEVKFGDSTIVVTVPDDVEPGDTFEVSVVAGSGLKKYFRRVAEKQEKVYPMQRYRNEETLTAHAAEMFGSQHHEDLLFMMWVLENGEVAQSSVDDRLKIQAEFAMYIALCFPFPGVVTLNERDGSDVKRVMGKIQHNHREGCRRTDERALVVDPFTSTPVHVEQARTFKMQLYTLTTTNKGLQWRNAFTAGNTQFTEPTYLRYLSQQDDEEIRLEKGTSKDKFTRVFAEQPRHANAIAKSLSTAIQTHKINTTLQMYAKTNQAQIDVMLWEVKRLVSMYVEAAKAQYYDAMHALAEHAAACIGITDKGDFEYVRCNPQKERELLKLMTEYEALRLLLAGIKFSLEPVEITKYEDFVERWQTLLRLHLFDEDLSEITETGDDDFRASEASRQFELMRGCVRAEFSRNVQGGAAADALPVEFQFDTPEPTWAQVFSLVGGREMLALRRTRQATNQQQGIARGQLDYLHGAIQGMYSKMQENTQKNRFATEWGEEEMQLHNESEDLSEPAYAETVAIGMWERIKQVKVQVFGQHTEPDHSLSAKLLKSVDEEIAAREEQEAQEEQADRSDSSDDSSDSSEDSGGA